MKDLTGPIAALTMLLVAAPGGPATAAGPAAAAPATTEAQLVPYLEALRTGGRDPVDFVVAQLEDHDLLLFDDALHPAVEPFEFYAELIRAPRFAARVRYIFLEAVGVDQQPALDAYLAAATERPELLHPAFQNDFSGTGWAYQTYFDLLRAVREANGRLPAEQRYEVVAVNAPTYWPLIRTPRDLELFRLSLKGNDYTMYRIIRSTLGDFESGEKGVFLTNTRHAYKGIRDGRGGYYWNCGTFFHVNDPGRTCSLRIHNAAFVFEGRRDPGPDTRGTTQGLEDVVMRWVRMEDGLWDEAFHRNGDAPVALAIEGTPFGDAAYIGNHMLDVEPGQTMSDAYDAVIFLAPLERMRWSARNGDLYTDAFRTEIVRRLGILLTPREIEARLTDGGHATLREYVDAAFGPRPEGPLPMLAQLGPREDGQAATARR